jgi:hypothetical protein
LTKALRDCGHGESDIAPDTAIDTLEDCDGGQAELRREAAAPYSWIAQKLNVGNLKTLRSNVRRWQLLHHALA